jgi:hypothetical protein
MSGAHCGVLFAPRALLLFADAHTASRSGGGEHGRGGAGRVGRRLGAAPRVPLLATPRARARARFRPRRAAGAPSRADAAPPMRTAACARVVCSSTKATRAAQTWPRVARTLTPFSPRIAARRAALRRRGGARRRGRRAPAQRDVHQRPAGASFALLALSLFALCVVVADIRAQGDAAPFELVEGHVASAQVSLPWRALLSAGPTVHLSGVTLRLAPRAAPAAGGASAAPAPTEAVRATLRPCCVDSLPALT